jgi:hypothetical protein
MPTDSCSYNTTCKGVIMPRPRPARVRALTDVYYSSTYTILLRKVKPGWSLGRAAPRRSRCPQPGCTGSRSLPGYDPCGPREQVQGPQAGCLQPGAGRAAFLGQDRGGEESPPARATHLRRGRSGQVPTRGSPGPNHLPGGRAGHPRRDTAVTATSAGGDSTGDCSRGQAGQDGSGRRPSRRTCCPCRPAGPAVQTGAAPSGPAAEGRG